MEGEGTLMGNWKMKKQFQGSQETVQEEDTMRTTAEKQDLISQGPEETAQEKGITDDGVKCVDESTAEEEKKKLTLVRATVEKQDLASKDIDDLTMRRFLRARDQNVEKASAMLLKYLEWRRAFVRKGFIAASEVSNEIAQNKMFIQGTDKKGRPIAVVFGAKHFANKGDEFKRFLVFALDKLCARMPAGQEKFTIIGDLEGYGYANSDVRAYLAALSILQDFYPERLGKVFVIHAPYIFMTVWKIIYPFIDQNTKKKIVFVGNKQLQSTLLEGIDESQLPEIYGGKLKLIPIQDSA